MNILVTGANGFLGSNLVRELILMGHKVYAQSKKGHNFIHPNLTNLNFDLIDINKINLEIEIDVIFHTAARINLEENEIAHTSLTEDNIIATNNLADFALKQNIKKFIHSSSCSVYNQNYFDSKKLITEQERLKPKNSYAISKLVSEWILQRKLNGYIKELIILRYSSIYGLGQKKDSIIPIFINNAKKNIDIDIFGSGKRMQDYVYIENVINANIKCLATELPFNTILNIGSGERITDTRLAKQIREIWNSKSKINILNQLHDPETYFTYDISKAKKLISYKPYNLKEGLELYKKSMCLL